MRMCVFGGIFCEIYSFDSSLYDFWILVDLRVHFWSNFLVFKIFKHVFGVIMCDFRGIYLVNIICLRAPYMIFGYICFGGPFWNAFGFFCKLKTFWNYV